MRIRTFTELVRFSTFEERFDYLKLEAGVGVKTFGYDRWMNQDFYRSREWKNIRDEVIARDYGCDLAIRGYEIHDRILVHHMNPMTSDDIVHDNDDILNPEFLISVAHRTHNAIHFGDRSRLRQPLVERRPGDTKLWGRR